MSEWYFDMNSNLFDTKVHEFKKSIFDDFFASLRKTEILFIWLVIGLGFFRI